jgi:predicted phosphodiesterase
VLPAVGTCSAASNQLRVTTARTGVVGVVEVDRLAEARPSRTLAILGGCSGTVMDNRRLRPWRNPPALERREVNVDARGRSCPLAYQYRPEALAQPAQVQADTLLVVGGLYGNAAALQAVLQRAEREPGAPATIVFNGDFHWLDVDPEDFRTISETVLAHHATKGNVEAELASEQDAGCGCAYPDYVSDEVVDRSNQIMTRLRTTAARFPALVRRLGALPRFLTANVGGQRIGIIHGDPESLSGWRLALEAMEPGDPLVRRQVGWRGRPTTAADLLDWFGRADVSVLASTHTGLPYAQDVTNGQRRRLVVNNGSAGLPNFANTAYGVMTRLSSSLQPPTDSLYGITIGTLRCDAVPVAFDLAWKARFLAQWPPGSPGHDQYLARITRGAQLRLSQAARGGVKLTASA